MEYLNNKEQKLFKKILELKPSISQILKFTKGT